MARSLRTVIILESREWRFYFEEEENETHTWDELFKMAEDELNKLAENFPDDIAQYTYRHAGDITPQYVESLRYDD